MSLKTILVVLDQAEDSFARLDLACGLAEDHGAHLSVLAMSHQIANYMVSGIDAGAGMVDVGQINESRSEAQALAAAARKRVDASGVIGEVRWASHEAFGLREVAGIQGRHADLTIAGQPAAGHSPELREAVLEGALFSSGRPVLMVPASGKDALKVRHVIVAWDGTRQAARALGDAGAFIDRAEKTTIVVVDPKPDEGDLGPDPGADIAAVVARHCSNVELDQIPSISPSTADAIIERAVEANGDLIVMGGYGHSVVRESIFGGVSRDMIQSTTVALLLSH